MNSQSWKVTYPPPFGLNMCSAVDDGWGVSNTDESGEVPEPPPPPLFPVTCNPLLLLPLAAVWLLISLWYRTSSSTFSLCFLDIRPNFTAENKKRKYISESFDPKILLSLLGLLLVFFFCCQRRMQRQAATKTWQRNLCDEEERQKTPIANPNPESRSFFIDSEGTRLQSHTLTLSLERNNTGGLTHSYEAKKMPTKNSLCNSFLQLGCVYDYKLQSDLCQTLTIDLKAFMTFKAKNF